MFYIYNNIITEKNKNTRWAKLKKTFTSVLPVAKNRKHNCIDCGVCCKLPNICPFLKFKDDWKSYCSVYKIRPLNCRKYPRTKSECVTGDTCGFKFE